MHYISDVVKNSFEVSKVFSPCLPTKTPLMPGKDVWVLLSFLLCCDSAQYQHARTRSCYLTTAFIRTVKLDIRKTIFVGVFGTKKATASVVRATLSNLYKKRRTNHLRTKYKFFALIINAIVIIIVVITHVISMQNIPSKNVALRNKPLTKRGTLV